MVMELLAGAGLATNLIGGLFGRSAAKKAAQQQAEAAARAKQEVLDRTKEANAELIGAGSDVGKQVRTAAGEGIARVDESTRSANERLDPYATAGAEANEAIRMGVAPGGDFNKTPSLADLQMDPGYAFREKQGLQALDRSAAARGGALGGGAIKSTLQYSQGLASQEFQNAFDRFRTSAGDRFSRLNTIAGRGSDVSTTQGSNLIGAGKTAADLNLGSAEYAGDKNYDATRTAGQNTINASQVGAEYGTQEANAKASGIIGGHNALWGGITGGVDAATGAIALRDMLKDPARKANLLNRFKRPNYSMDTSGVYD